MIIAPRRYQHPSSGANRPSDIAVTVNFNGEFNLMPVNPIIECFARDLDPEYCQGLESSAVYAAPPFFVESFHGHSNRSPPRLLLHMHADQIIPTILTSNIYIGLCLPKSLTTTRLRPNTMFEVLLIVRINNCMGLQGILNICLLRDTFRYWLACGIPLKEGVPDPLQSKVRTPTLYLR